MSAPAAIQGDYADLRVVKSRKVVQVIVEIPIEQSDAFVQAFGMPRPAEGTPVALARITAAADVGISTTEQKQRVTRRFEDLPPAQQAGIRCSDEAFWRYLSEVYPQYHVGCPDAAAEAVRDLCGVASRSDLNRFPDAERCWNTINSKFDVWMRWVPA